MIRRRSLTSPRSVTMLPVYRHNPYQRLLAAALEREGWHVTLAPSERERRAPIVRAWWSTGRPRVLHLHWVHDFLGGSRGGTTRGTALWFTTQLRLLRLLRVRLVWTAHNLKGHETEGDEREIEANRALVELADGVIVHCEAARLALIDAYAPSQRATARLRVIEHGSYVGHYPDDMPAEEARRRLGIPESGPVFAFFGAIRAYKGVADLVDAFMRIADAGPNARLLICGKPLPKRIGVELQGRAAADPRIILKLDRLPEDELTLTLRAADAAVLPFRDVLTSGTVVLAMSQGRAVIAPRLGCLPETLPDDAAVLYEPDEDGALEAALRRALRSDLAQMGRRARARAEQLDWGAIAARTAALYEGD